MSSRRNYGIGGDNIDHSGLAHDVLRAILIALAIAGGICWATSCSPRIYERVVYQKDTTYVSQVDSIYKYERDSVFVKEKGDTVYKYVERVRYRDRYKVDTLIKVKVDSAAVERIKEVKVEKPLSWWQKAKIGAFWWLLGALIVCLLWIFRKLIF